MVTNSSSPFAFSDVDSRRARATRRDEAWTLGSDRVEEVVAWTLGGAGGSSLVPFETDLVDLGDARRVLQNRPDDRRVPRRHPAKHHFLARHHRIPHHGGVPRVGGQGEHDQRDCFRHLGVVVSRHELHRLPRHAAGELQLRLLQEGAELPRHQEHNRADKLHRLQPERGVVGGHHDPLHDGVDVLHGGVRRVHRRQGQFRGGVPCVPCRRGLHHRVSVTRVDNGDHLRRVHRRDTVAAFFLDCLALLRDPLHERATVGGGAVAGDRGRDDDEDGEGDRVVGAEGGVADVPHDDSDAADVLDRVRHYCQDRDAHFTISVQLRK
ncbi:hypothetical protein Cni_G13233 [Canna indica]|uniref:Uncharacterized protein n=1 Tax=Canna indica TaxID=4628 RepID=A0AAQ3K9W4_9LILI|nr:hypothetical protein Cni_G13233 [Canna indica]